MPLRPVTLHNTSLTLEQFWSGVRWTTAERVELASRLEVVAEAKVGDFDVQVGIKQKIFCLSTITAINLKSDTMKLHSASDIQTDIDRQTDKLMMTDTKTHNEHLMSLQLRLFTL